MALFEDVIRLLEDQSVEKASIEREGQEIANLHCLKIPLQVGHCDVRLSAEEIRNHLSAGAAGSNRLARRGNHRNLYEVSRALGDRLEDGHSLSANAQTIGRILHVTARKDASVAALDCGAHLKV